MVRLVPALAIVLMGSLAGTANVVSGQDAPSTNEQQVTRNYTWFGFGAGRTISGNSTVVMELNHVYSPHLFTIRYLGEWPGKSLSEGLLAESWSEIGLLYGRSAAWKWGRASLGAGVSATWETSASGSVTWTSVGLPLQATLYLTIPYRPVDWIGLQVGAHANVNPERSFAGATVGLVIGKLR